MTTLAEFSSNFAGGDVPPALAKLLAFQDQHGFESYSECFGLLADDKGGLRSWSSDERFLSRLMPFAQATGGGSFYALWAHRPGANTSEMPVVVFGDEGGVHVIAEDVAHLLRLLTFDVEPMVDHDGVTFYKAKDHEPRDDHDAYVDWLKAELDLDPIDDPGPLVAAAQARYKADFDAWFSDFV
jgi:hypothetical protein